MARTLTDHSARVLDGFTAQERRTLLRLAAGADEGSPLGKIVQAAAVAANDPAGAGFLVDEVDHLTAEERQAVLRVAVADFNTDSRLSVLGRLVQAAATEIRVRQLEEDELFLGRERDRDADMDALHAGWPLPAGDPALRLTFDPETGEFRPDPGPGAGVSP